jgi:ParB family chromosome partitioning protein
MSEQARRGLGRGLSALLGESFDLNRPVGAPQPAAPQPAAPTSPAQPAADAPNPASNVTSFPPPWMTEMANEADAEAPPVAQRIEPASAPSSATQGAGAHLAPIELIQRNPGQPRQHFDEKELEDLADSIRRHGVLQPILVRPLPGHEGRFEIVAGERRWRAAQKAQLHQVPIVVRELDEQEVLEIAIIENVQRSDLNPIEEAAGYSQLMSRFGRTQQDVAEVVGKSRPHIANMLRLLTLPEAIQQMVREGKLSGGHARACVTAHDPLALARRAVTEGLNVRQIEQLATQAKDERSGIVRAASSGAGKDADTRALEASMSEKLGLTVTISAKGEGGEVKIAYAKLEQLDEIARRLSNG